MNELPSSAKKYTKTLKKIKSYDTSTWHDFTTDLFKIFIESELQIFLQEHISLSPYNWDIENDKYIINQYNNAKSKLCSLNDNYVPHDIDTLFIKYLIQQQKLMESVIDR